MADTDRIFFDKFLSNHFLTSDTVPKNEIVANDYVCILCKNTISKSTRDITVDIVCEHCSTIPENDIKRCQTFARKVDCTFSRVQSTHLTEIYYDWTCSEGHINPKLKLCDVKGRFYNWLRHSWCNTCHCIKYNGMVSDYLNEEYGERLPIVPGLNWSIKALIKKDEDHFKREEKRAVRKKTEHRNQFSDQYETTLWKEREIRGEDSDEEKAIERALTYLNKSRSDCDDDN